MFRLDTSFKRAFLVIGMVVSVALLAACSRGGAGPAAPSGDTSSDVKSAAMNATYEVEGSDVTLQDGKAEEAIPDSSTMIKTQATDHFAAGDLSGTGTTDGAIVLIQDPGGSGTFRYVAALLEEDGGYQGTNAEFIGDRIAIQSISISDQLITVTYLDRAEDEPMSAEPTLERTQQYRIEGTTLVTLD